MPLVNNVTFVMPYYDNPVMLARHLKCWDHYPPKALERTRFIIVDDGSPNSQAADVVHKNATPAVLRRMAVFRIKPDIPWNQDGARNLGMAHVQTEWAFMTDMDRMVHASQIGRMLTLDGQPCRMYMPEQHQTDGTVLAPHPNTFLLRVSDFNAMGGYDEDFAGWYGSDGYFRRCAAAAGLREQRTDAFYTIKFRQADCEDASTRTLGRKGSELHIPNNFALFRKARGVPQKATRPLRFEWDRVI